MKRLLIAAVVTLVAVIGCSGTPESLAIEQGSAVVLETSRGVAVQGRLVEVRPDLVIIEAPDGRRTEVRRSDIASLTVDSRAGRNAKEPGGRAVPPVGTEDVGGRAPERAGHTAEDRNAPAVRAVTIPSGTQLSIELASSIGSASSRVEDPVRAVLSRPVLVDGTEALPAGTIVMGHVTSVERPGRVKGRGRIAFRFTSAAPAGSAERIPIRTATVTRLAPATKKEDAAKIGGGAAGGAVIGGILGGGDGAAKGAVVGGAAGTGLVLSTRGRDVTLGPGAALSVRLTEPAAVRIPPRQS
jgi:hypothetical protein